MFILSYIKLINSIDVYFDKVSYVTTVYVYKQMPLHWHSDGIPLSYYN